MANGLTEREPANHVLALEAALSKHRGHEGDVRQLGLGDLQHEGLLVEGVGLTPTHRRLAPAQLCVVWRHQRQLHTRIYARANSTPLRRGSRM